MTALFDTPIPDCGTACQLLHASYLTSGLVMAAAYLPQIVRGWRQPRATALALSLSSWLIWTGCRTIALAYGIVVMRDPLFGWVVGLDVCCRVVVLLVLLRARASVRGEADAFRPETERWASTRPAPDSPAARYRWHARS